MTLITNPNLPPELHRNPHKDETVEVECDYCSNTFHEDDIVNASDGGDEVFCSTDCRNEYEQDRAADRAESRAEAYS